MEIHDRDLLTDTPFLAVDLNVMEQNIKWMGNLAKAANLKFRPHIKTHKSPYIAQLQMDSGAVGITTATLGEAEVMVNAGIHNILIGFPIIGKRKLERFKRLHERAQIMVGLDDFKVAEGLNEIGKETDEKVSLYIDVDTGLGRMGRSLEDSIPSIIEISKLPYITIKGLMSHTGHAYAEATDEGVKAIGIKEAEILHQTKQRLAQAGIDVPDISVGATATARMIQEIPYITETRPGMYVFNDRYVMGAGGASENDCALTVFATVISHPNPQRLVIDAGSKTLSSDRFKHGGFGKVKDHDNLTITKLSEEHGVIEVAEGTTDLQVGDVIEIIPNHVCPAVNLANTLYGFREGHLERTIQVEARGLNR